MFKRLSLVLVIYILVGCGSATPTTTPPTANPTEIPTAIPTIRPIPQTSASAAFNMQNLIPKPSSITPEQGEFPVTADTEILLYPDNDELTRIGNFFADALRPATGFPLPVSAGAPSEGNIHFTLTGDTSLGAEGYEIKIAPETITVSAHQPAGLFYAVQTLRQLVPPRDGPWGIAAGTIRDVPRFAWRGAMLDVSRHFFQVDDVKRYIDEIAAYKINHFHLHLSDDQGWRIEIKSWDKLATYGGSTEVGGGAGGYYTQAQYSDLVQYAAERYITLVPEIDMPGHTNAALASYPELNCNNTAPALYTGTEVGFSSFCVDKEITYKFIDDVVRELAALTPGPYIHIGGDEARSTETADYIKFMTRVQDIVKANGKQMLGWEEISQIKLDPSSLAQHWNSSDFTASAARQGAHAIMSPASKAYLDMKYDSSTKLGLDWAGLVDVVKAYTWEPATEIENLDESAILGVEAPLWSETLTTLDDIEYMAFPRLFGIAEIGWSPKTSRDWNEYKQRLATHGPRLRAMGINFYRAPQVDWK